MAEAKGKKTSETAPRRRGSAFEIPDDVPDTAPAVRRPKLAAAPAPTKQAPAASAPAKDKKGPAFTWRRTHATIMDMDEMALRLKRETGVSRIDHAQILDGLVSIAVENPTVFAALASKISEPDA